ncbi:MAG: PfkB family carbohydrate kinase, partial [Endomicrobiia bacterium]
VKKILSWGPKAIIVKRGEYGAVYFDKNSIFYVPSYPLESVYDPTGAGDSFAGGLLGYIANKNKIDRKTIRQAIVFGSIMGSFAVEDFGLNRLSKVSRKDIYKRYCEFKKFTNF